MDCYRWEDNMPMGCDCEKSAVNFLFCNHHYHGNRSFAILSQSNEIPFHWLKQVDEMLVIQDVKNPIDHFSKSQFRKYEC